MLKQNIIEPCSSPLSSPVVLIKKADGTFRFCIDYRKVASLTKKHVFLIPRIDETLEALADTKVSTTLDMRSSYWQIEVEEGFHDVTAFRTGTGAYKLLRTPFGLVNSGSVYQRAYNLAFRKYLGYFVYCYVDDLFIYSKTFDEHMVHLDTILKQMIESGF
jgi:hypothetical protein